MRLGDFLVETKEVVAPVVWSDETPISVAMGGRGISPALRWKAERSKTPQQRVQAGDFVVLRQGAAGGGFAVVPEAFDKAILSTNFMRFAINDSIVDRKWWRWRIQSPAFTEMCARAGMGSAQSFLTARKLLALDVAVPVLSEQHRIVAVLEQADRAVEAAARHAANAEVLLKATVQSEILPADVDWDAATISDLVTPALRQEKVDNSRVYRMAGVRLYGNGPYLRETKIGSEIKATRLFRLAEGDFIYNKLFAGEGAFGLVGPELADAHVSNEFPVFICGPEAVDAKFLRYHFSLPDVIDGVRLACVGTTASRSRWHERKFLSYQLPLPPLAEQQAIVARIEKVEAAVRAAEAHLERLRVLRSSLLENLVSGRVRLPVPDATASEAAA